jgi:diguanylate cyclase (GGDEF)-like protein/PAS domain S-box-containing protein
MRENPGREGSSAPDRGRPPPNAAGGEPVGGRAKTTWFVPGVRRTDLAYAACADRIPARRADSRERTDEQRHPSRDPVVDGAARPTTVLFVPADRTEPAAGASDSTVESMLTEYAPGEFEVERVRAATDAVAYLERRATECAVVSVAGAEPEDLEVVEAIAARVPAVALVVLTSLPDDRLAVSTVHAGRIDLLSQQGLDAKFLVTSVRHAVLRKRFERALDEMQSMAKIGSWEADLAANSVAWSPELYRLLGISRETPVTYADLVASIHPDDRESTLQAIGASVTDKTPFLVEHRVLRRDGTTRWLRARGHPELDASGRATRLFGTAQDITDQQVLADELAHRELHDPLTGLPNRRLLLDRLGQALMRLARGATSVAVIHLDIDRFRVVNDSLGHAVGDRLLLTTATRLRYFVRPEDTLARIDSDEFVLLCEGLSGPDEAVAIADRICTEMARPIEWDGGDLVLSVTAGVALAASQSVEGDALLRDADAAMHRAKRDGGARSAVFASAMRDNVVSRLDTESSLRRSIVNGDLRVHYQPVVSLTNGQVLGHEALVRWDHPSRGLLGPDEFITIAEETGLIIPLGAWVLREACRQAKRFQDRDPRWPHLTMSVNLSGAQLGQTDLLDLIRSALRDAGLDAEDLQLEMTESVLMDDAATTIKVLQSLKDLGVRLSIDDFGTGYSSLAYLRRFPVDVLKIDRTFVGGLGKDLEDSAIVAAVVNLADTLGFTTVAEGVETELQRSCLVGLGCTRAQGYLFAQPSAAPEAEALLDHASGAVSNRR